MPGLSSKCRRDIRNEIPQVSGLHAGVSLRTDLLLIGEDRHGRERRILRLQDGGEGGIGADPIVVTVGADQAAVEAQVPRLEGRYGFELSGKEVRLGHAVFFMKDPQNVELDELAFVVIAQRPGANEDVEVLALDHFGGLAGHLLGREVGQQVGYAEHGIVRVLADADRHAGSVPEYHHSMQGQRDGRPLVFFDPAVVMGVKIRQVVVFIQRIRLQIEAG